MRDKTALYLTFGFTLLCLSATTAHAALKVCNRGGTAVTLALGRFDGSQWLSEGWWPLPARACATLLPEKLSARYYYLYASDGGAGVWAGSRVFCVKPSGKFRIFGRAKCAEHGYDSKSFFEVDTGQNPDWTQSLSD